MKLLLQAGADPNVRDEYSTPFKAAGKKRMRVMDGEYFRSHYKLPPCMVMQVQMHVLIR
jgi:hypothetical protein